MDAKEWEDGWIHWPSLGGSDIMTAEEGAMDADHDIGVAAEICGHVNRVNAEGGTSTIWLASGTLIQDVEVASMDGDMATFGYVIRKHLYKIRADHVVGVSYDFAD